MCSLENGSLQAVQHRHRFKDQTLCLNGSVSTDTGPANPSCSGDDDDDVVVVVVVDDDDDDGDSNDNNDDE